MSRCFDLALSNNAGGMDIFIYQAYPGANRVFQNLFQLHRSILCLLVKQEHLCHLVSSWKEMVLRYYYNLANHNCSTCLGKWAIFHINVCVFSLFAVDNFVVVVVDSVRSRWENVGESLDQKIVGMETTWKRMNGTPRREWYDWIATSTDLSKTRQPEQKTAKNRLV